MTAINFQGNELRHIISTDFLLSSCDSIGFSFYSILCSGWIFYIGNLLSLLLQMFFMFRTIILTNKLINDTRIKINVHQTRISSTNFTSDDWIKKSKTVLNKVRSWQALRTKNFERLYWIQLNKCKLFLGRIA